MLEHNERLVNSSWMLDGNAGSSFRRMDHALLSGSGEDKLMNALFLIETFVEYHGRNVACSRIGCTICSRAVWAIIKCSKICIKYGSYLITVSYQYCRREQLNNVVRDQVCPSKFSWNTMSDS